MRAVLSFVPIAGAFLSATGCGGGKPPVAPPEPPLVTFERPVARDLDALAEFTGRLVAVESQEVRAQVTGYLKEIKFEEGGIVQAGQPLYEIDPEPYDAALLNAAATAKKAENDVTTAERQLALAKADYDRAKAAGPAVGREDLDKRKTAVDTGEVAVAAAKAALDAVRATEKKAKFDRANCTVRSEVKGAARVSRTEITKGNLVQAGQTLLCKVTSLDPIFAYWDVDEDTSLMYRRLVFDEKKLPNPRSDKPEERLKCWIGMKDETRGPDGKWPHEGYVDYVAPEIVRGLGTREIRARLANPGPNYRLGPGDSVRVQVTAGPTEKLITVPEIAVGSQQQQKFVYVIVEKDGKPVAEFRPVRLGPVREVGGVRLQVITSGVTPADRVVVNGLLRVRPGAEVKPTEQTTPVSSLADGVK
jgi:RND family efflux transporter MFP subunit